MSLRSKPLNGFACEKSFRARIGRSARKPASHPGLAAKSLLWNGADRLCTKKQISPRMTRIYKLKK